MKRVILILLVAYVLVVGATYNGVLDANQRMIDAVLVAATFVTWIVWRRRWTWYRTPLDWAILLWMAAFALSLVANLDSWRRIAIGLWFMALFIGVWYVLQDAFANGGLKRAWLVDALLAAGAPILFVSYAQVEVAVTSGAALPRPGGTLGNPNALASVLALLLPLIAGRLFAARRPFGRVLYAFYGATALIMLALTFSRAGWVAGAAALGVWAILSLPLRRWWERFTLPVRGLVIGIGVIGAAAMAYVIIESFGIAGRGVDLRTFIYATALHLFAAHPITGTGLFTFGAGLSQFNSLPPLEPHSHAHNIILHVAAELGIVGLVALGLTALVVARAVLRVERTDRVAVMGIAAFAGFIVHQMFDIPAMMPAIALMALAVLTLVIPARDKAKRGRWQPLVLAVGGIALCLTGLWSALNYREYVSAISDGLTTSNYQAAADRLQALIDHDPSLAIYHEERGMLLGFAAQSGDLQAAQQAADSFTHYTALEPNYASGWANLAALDEQLGKLKAAETAMQRAAALAPESWSLNYRAGVYAEAAGDPDTARADYQQALQWNSEMPLLLDWDTSPLRQSLASGTGTLNRFSQTVLRLENGDLAGAQQLWQSDPDRYGDFSNRHVLALMFALAQGDITSAHAELQAAQRIASSANDFAWVDLGAALLDRSQFDARVAAAQAQLQVTLTEPDWELGANIAYIQYLHLAIPRLFLPQVGYSEADVNLVHLFNSPNALTTLRAAIHA
ncbi:MAG TPA: O-antigen ligase family protein [Phototrophicaceae bacterium]|nr:O-antigen ligase family protein [Phototrophicaceae bacterium]